MNLTKLPSIVFTGERTPHGNVVMVGYSKRTFDLITALSRRGVFVSGDYGWGADPPEQRHRLAAGLMSLIFGSLDVREEWPDAVAHDIVPYLPAKGWVITSQHVVAYLVARPMMMMMALDMDVQPIPKPSVN